MIDGTGLPRYSADVGIARGHIAKIGDLQGDQAGVSVDARGWFVVPGFINIHSHPEEDAVSTAENMLTQGITTEIDGPDGWGSPDIASQARKFSAKGSAANLGFYVGDVPGLHAVFMSRKVLPEAGHPHLHAVHLGNHEGLDGWVLAVTALLLRPVLAQMRPTRLRLILSGYLALLLGYGVMVSANDGWNEQVVKRGWTSHGLPSVLNPALNLGWAILIVVAVVLYLAAFRVRTAGPVLA